jgi:hypothetical protein
MQSEDEDLEIPDEPDEPDEPEIGGIQPNKDAVGERLGLLASRKQIDARLEELGCIDSPRVSLPCYHCLRCGHNWIGRNPDTAPTQCPRCGICLWWQMPTRIGAKIEGVGGLSDKWRQRRRKKRGKSREESARAEPNPMADQLPRGVRLHSLPPPQPVSATERVLAVKPPPNPIPRRSRCNMHETFAADS